MTLDILDRKITALRDKANTIRQTYQDTVTRVTGDQNLSLEGKAAQLNGLFDKTVETTTALKAEEDKLIADERLYLERVIGGTVGGDVISYRDARDRAAAIDNPRVAEEAMRDALRSQDGELAKALLDRSIDWRFREAVDLYVGQNPTMGDRINDLFDLASLTSDANFRMTQSFAYVIPR